MENFPIPGEVEIVYTTKKITLKGPAKYIVRDPRNGEIIEEIVVEKGGEFDGKVADINVKGRLLSSAKMSEINDAAIGGKIAPPTIEVAMELPQDIVDSPATRMVLSVSDRFTKADLSIVAYGSNASFHSVSGEKAMAFKAAEPRAGHTWVGFRISNIDYARLARYYHPSDLLFTLSAEQINGSHRYFGPTSRGSIMILDGESQQPLLSYMSDVQRVMWPHVIREQPSFGLRDVQQKG